MFGTVRQLPSRKDTPRKKHGRWQARYTGPDSVRHKAPSTFATKTDALGWLAAEKRLIDLGTWEPPAVREDKARRAEQQQRYTVAALVTDWLENPRELKEATYKTYRRTIRNRITQTTSPAVQRLVDTPVTEFDRKQAHEWWDTITREFDTPPTNHKAYVYLHAAFDWAVERELIPANPVQIREAAKKPKPKPKRLPQNGELLALLEAVPARYKFVTMLFFFMGLRISEALGLEHKHLVNVGTASEPRWQVRVEQQLSRLENDNGQGVYVKIETPKTAASYRTVPIMPEFNAIVVEHLEKYAGTAPVTLPTFTGQREVRLLTVTAGNNRPLLDTSARNVVNRAQERLGVKVEKIAPHYGRVWFITRLAEEGATPAEIGFILGQEDLSTITEIYMKARPENVQRAVSRVGASLGGNVVDLSAARRAREEGDGSEVV